MHTPAQKFAEKTLQIYYITDFEYCQQKLLNFLYIMLAIYPQDYTLRFFGRFYCRMANEKERRIADFHIAETQSVFFVRRDL